MVTYQDDSELLKESLYADSYAAPFTTNNDAANKAVQDYICRNTKGLINNEYNYKKTYFASNIDSCELHFDFNIDNSSVVHRSCSTPAYRRHT